MLYYLRLFALFAQTEFQREIEYRANLAMEVAQMVMFVATSVGAVLVLFNYTEALNGWTLAQMLVLLGVYYFIRGVADFVFLPSVTQMMEHIRLGTLDYTLLKPANSQFLVSLRQLNVVQIAQIALGSAVIGLGVSRLGEVVTVATAAAFAVALACGVVLVYAVLMILATFSFWFVKVDNILVIFASFMDAGRFPVDLYPGWLRLTLSTIVPVGVAVTLPAQAIAGRLDALSLGAMIAVGLAATWFTTWFWRRGLASYSGASA
jgi:ABC-2 type transport system permease protein